MKAHHQENSQRSTSPLLASGSQHNQQIPSTAYIPRLNLLNNNYDPFDTVSSRNGDEQNFPLYYQSYRIPQVSDTRVPQLNIHHNSSIQEHHLYGQQSTLLSNRTNQLSSRISSPFINSSRQAVNNILGINLESTQELKAFVTIDLEKINKDRQNQLKLALEDNLREKEQAIVEIQKSYQTQREEYQKVSRQLESCSTDLESAISRQRENMVFLKRQAAQIDCDQQKSDKDHNAFTQKQITLLNETDSQLQKLQEELSTVESETHMLKLEKQSLTQKIDIRKKFKMQELDSQLGPLQEQKEQIALSFELLNQNLQILEEVRDQNENEKMMIKEDLEGSNQNKVGLIYQREEIEQYIEKTKMENLDLKFVSDMVSTNINQIEDQEKWEQVKQALITEKQRCLLLDLIRELHQYILGLSSNTTDNSVMQSDELEELQCMIEKKLIAVSDAVEMISSFAQSKMRLDLSSEVLLQKLNTVNESFDNEIVLLQIQELLHLDEQMKEFDHRIKVITNRQHNELLPRLKAVRFPLIIIFIQLQASERQMQEEIVKVQQNLREVQLNMELNDQQMQEVQISFEQTQQINIQYDQEPLNPSTKELEEKVDVIECQIEEMQLDIDQIRQEIQYKQSQKDQIIEEMQRQDIEMEEKKRELKEKYMQIMEEIKREKSLTLQFEFSNPEIQEMTGRVAQLKCDKESAYKRMKYIEVKLHNAQESVQHAKQVLDNHVLQMQQEQLHQKVNHNQSVQSATYNKKRMTSLNASQMKTLEDKASLSRRLTNIQQKSISLVPGKILSPGRETSSPKGSHRLDGLKTDLVPQRVNHHPSSSVMNFVRDSQPYSQLNDNSSARIHNHFIEPVDDSKTVGAPYEMEKVPFKKHPKTTMTHASIIINDRTDQSEKLLSQKHKDIIKAYLNNKDKSISAADLVRYKHDSSAALSFQEDLQSSQISNNKFRNDPQNNNAFDGIIVDGNRKMIPIQTFITPRDAHQEMMQYNHSHQISQVSQPNLYELAIDNFNHTSSIGSNDSVRASNSNRNESDFYYIQRQREFGTIENSQTGAKKTKGFIDTCTLPSVKISLRQSHNSSLDSKSLASSMNQSINFKENVAPNQATNNVSTLNSINIKKLSQAASLSQLQSFLNATQNSNHTTIQNNKPPAVPQSKVAQTAQENNIVGSSSKKSQTIYNSHRNKRISSGFHEHASVSSHQTSQFNSQRQSQNAVQTKMRLCQNSNNGKVIAVGTVDLSKCNQSLVQKDIQFFDSVKHLIEGTHFLTMNKLGQYQPKHLYLDFSLLRIFLNGSTTSSTERKEVLMVENILKTELPQQTLDLIKTEKSQNFLSTSQFSQRKYEFQIIFMNPNSGLAERMQLVTQNYEDLRQWIIGLNALISNKNNLMRLSLLIKT